MRVLDWLGRRLDSAFLRRCCLVAYLLFFKKYAIYEDWNALYYDDDATRFFPSVFAEPPALRNLAVVPIRIITKTAYFVDISATFEDLQTDISRRPAGWQQAFAIGLHPALVATFFSFLAFVRALITPDRVGEALLLSTFLIIFITAGRLGFLAWAAYAGLAIDAENGLSPSPSSSRTAGLYYFLAFLSVFVTAPILSAVASLRSKFMKQRLYFLRTTAVVQVLLVACVSISQFVYRGRSFLSCSTALPLYFQSSVYVYCSST